MTNEDKQDLVEATLIQQAMNDKYLNVKRFLRNMADVEDHYAKTEGKEDIGAMLKAILNKQSNEAGDRAKVDVEDIEQRKYNELITRLDKLEARGQ